MKCPKCGGKLQKAKTADVYLCLECGTRARLVIDPVEPSPVVLPWIQPYTPYTPYTPSLPPVWVTVGDNTTAPLHTHVQVY